MSEAQGNAVRKLARRGSDHPHLFKEIDGFRTCRTCGLATAHKIHAAENSANLPPQATQEQDGAGSTDDSSGPTLDEPALPYALPKPTVRQIFRCPSCRKLNITTDSSCYWCGTELPPVPPPALEEATKVALPFLAGYGEKSPARETPQLRLASKTNRFPGWIRWRSPLRVLQILVIVLLLAGAGTAVRIMHSSSASKPAATPSSVVVTIAPASAQVVSGKAFDFAAAVGGANEAQVIWRVQEGAAGGRVVTRATNAKNGTVASLAVYIAPGKAGTYHLLATSKADPRQSASAEVNVTARQERPGAITGGILKEAGQ